MPKHHKKTPDYPVDQRSTKETFLNYCKECLDFVEANDTSYIICNSIDAEELTESGFKGNRDVKFNRPGTIDKWVSWWVENESVKVPKITYSEFIQNLRKIEFKEK